MVFFLPPIATRKRVGGVKPNERCAVITSSSSINLPKNAKLGGGDERGNIPLSRWAPALQSPA